MEAAVRRALSQAPLAELHDMLPGMQRRGGHGWQLLRDELQRRPSATIEATATEQPFATLPGLHTRPITLAPRLNAAIGETVAFEPVSPPK